MLLKDRANNSKERTEEEAFNDFQSWIEAPPSEQVMHTIAAHILRGYKKWPEAVTERWLELAEDVLLNYPKPVGCPQEFLMEYALNETPFPPMRMFRLLRISEERINAEQVSLVFGHPDLCHVEIAMLIDMRVDDAGVQALLESVAAKQLKILDLQHNRITDMGAMLLASSTKVSGLTHLSLFTNLIGETGLRALLKSKQLSSLERLSIGGQGGLSPETMIEVLSSTTLPPNLIELRLEFCNFQDHHLPQLAAIPALSQLEEIYFTGNELSENAIQSAQSSGHLQETQLHLP